MSVISEVVDNSLNLTINNEMTIYCAEKLRQDLSAIYIEKLDGNIKKITVDLSSVDEMDSSGLQLLLALKKTAISKNVSFTIKKFHPAVEEVLNLSLMKHQLSAASKPVH